MQMTDDSFGRYPDGSELHKLSKPTPLASNLYTGIRPLTDPEYGFELFQNYPNPFRNQTSIGYMLNNAGRIELNVYDFTRRRVATLVSGFQPPGTFEVSWNADDTAPGIYFCELSTLKGRQLMRMVLTK